MTQPSTDHPQSRKPGEHLLDSLKTIHAHLRHDLAVCRTLADQVAAGATPEHIRAQIESLQTSSPLWKLRVNCLYYCRVVYAHHSIEDAMMFPALQQVNPDLGPVVDKLMADHRRVSRLLDEIEASASAWWWTTARASASGSSLRWATWPPICWRISRLRKRPWAQPSLSWKSGPIDTSLLPKDTTGPHISTDAGSRAALLTLGRIHSQPWSSG